MRTELSRLRVALMLKLHSDEKLITQKFIVSMLFGLVLIVLTPFMSILSIQLGIALSLFLFLRILAPVLWHITTYYGYELSVEMNLQQMIIHDLCVVGIFCAINILMSMIYQVLGNWFEVKSLESFLSIFAGYHMIVILWYIITWCSHLIAAYRSPFPQEYKPKRKYLLLAGSFVLLIQISLIVLLKWSGALERVS